MVKVITFYTPEYKDEADQLVSSAYKFGIDVKAYAKPSKGSWVHNCTMKAEVVLEALNEFGCGVLWVDADARFKDVPSLFDKLDLYDFGCYWIPDVWNQKRNSHLRPWGPHRGNEALAGGTMYFNNTTRAVDLIYAWREEATKNPTVWEQQSLQKVWDKHDKEGLKTFCFSQTYCRVFDAPWFEPQKPVVIEHTQASRKLKGKVNAVHK
jgi:hypothetical protein